MSGLYIRSKHPYGYRSGQWASVHRVSWVEAVDGTDGRAVFHVRWIDGESDLWPVVDEHAEYEFSNRVSA